jgi:hypothetical protein
MTDHEEDSFERELPNILRDLAPDAPDSLRAVVAAVPVEVDSRMSRSRTWWQFGGSIAAAAVVAVVALVALSNRPVGPSPSASPSSDGSSVATTSPSSLPSPAPSSPISGVPAVQVPPADVHSLILPGNATIEAAWGPHLYGVVLGDVATADQLLVADMTNGSINQVDLPLTNGEHVTNGFGYWDEVPPVATEGHWLAIVVWHRLGPQGIGGAPCSSDSGQPLAWRILTAPIDSSTGLPSGPFVVAQVGESKRTFTLFGQGEGCSGPRLPRISVADGRLAYDTEDATSDRPFGSRITLHSLDGTRPDQVLSTSSQVIYLGISGTTVAWTEVATDPGTGGQPAWSVRVSTDPASAARSVGLGADPTSFRLPAEIRLDGDTVAWTRIRLDLPDDGWVTSLTGGSPRIVSPPSVSCTAGGLAGGTLGLQCVSADGTNQNVVLAWSAVRDLHVLVGVPPPQRPPLVSNGWLVYDAGSQAISGMTLSALGN